MQFVDSVEICHSVQKRINCTITLRGQGGLVQHARPMAPGFFFFEELQRALLLTFKSNYLVLSMEHMSTFTSSAITVQVATIVCAWFWVALFPLKKKSLMMLPVSVTNLHYFNQPSVVQSNHCLIKRCLQVH